MVKFGNGRVSIFLLCSNSSACVEVFGAWLLMMRSFFLNQVLKKYIQIWI